MRNSMFDQLGASLERPGHRGHRGARDLPDTTARSAARLLLQALPIGSSRGLKCAGNAVNAARSSQVPPPRGLTCETMLPSVGTNAIARTPPKVLLDIRTPACRQASPWRPRPAQLNAVIGAEMPPCSTPLFRRSAALGLAPAHMSCDRRRPLKALQAWPPHESLLEALVFPCALGPCRTTNGCRNLDKSVAVRLRNRSATSRRRRMRPSLVEPHGHDHKVRIADRLGPAPGTAPDDEPAPVPRTRPS